MLLELAQHASSPEAHATFKPRQRMMARWLSPELSLAAACAVWPPSDSRSEAIRVAAAGPLDWAHYLRVVRRHRVVGLVHEGLKRAKVDMPPETAREIGSRATKLVFESLAMAAEAARLQRLFDDAGLQVLFLKGASLAVLAYGNLGLRESKDIDLLVSYKGLPTAVHLITGVGYRRSDPPLNVSDAQLRLLMSIRRDLVFIHEETGLQLELHWRPFLNPHAMDLNSFVTASRIVPLTETMGVRTLGDEDLFTYLCVHGALHCWHQLKWLADIGALLAVAPEGGPERFSRAAESRGAGRAAAQAILLCQRVLDIRFPTSLSKKFGKSLTMRWLEHTTLEAMTAGRSATDRHELRFGTTRGSLSALILRKNWRYRLIEFFNLLTNETDVLTVPLPASLRFLYPIVRVPLWVWRHATRWKAN